MLKLGIYENRNGEKFEVIGQVKHGETKEDLILYRSLITGEQFVAPESMFNEVSEINGLEIPRWTFLGDNNI